MRLLIKCFWSAGELAQCVRMLATRPTDLSSTVQSHMVEGEN